MMTTGPAGKNLRAGAPQFDGAAWLTAPGKLAAPAKGNVPAGILSFVRRALAAVPLTPPQAAGQPNGAFGDPIPASNFMGEDVHARAATPNVHVPARQPAAQPKSRPAKPPGAAVPAARASKGQPAAHRTDKPPDEGLLQANNEKLVGQELSERGGLFIFDRFWTGNVGVFSGTLKSWLSNIFKPSGVEFILTDLFPSWDQDLLDIIVSRNGVGPTMIEHLQLESGKAPDPETRSKLRRYIHFLQAAAREGYQVLAIGGLNPDAIERLVDKHSADDPAHRKRYVILGNANAYATARRLGIAEIIVKDDGHISRIVDPRGAAEAQLLAGLRAVTYSGGLADFVEKTCKDVSPDLLSRALQRLDSNRISNLGEDFKALVGQNARLVATMFADAIAEMPKTDVRAQFVAVFQAGFNEQAGRQPEIAAAMAKVEKCEK
jgi:hypothetical protein